LKADLEKRTIILVLVLAVGVFYSTTLRKGHNPGGDFAQYILHAKNLAQGAPYADTGYIYNPHYPALGPRAYPPVLPFLLAPIVKCFGLNLASMKILVIFFFMLSLVACASLVRRSLPFIHAVAVLLITGLNPFFWNFKDDVASDIPFLFFVFLFLWFVDRQTRGPIAKTANHFIDGLVCGLIMALAFGTRTIGLALPVVLLLYEFYRLRKVSSFAMVSCAVFLALTAAQSLVFRGGNSYLDQFRGLTLGVVLHNAMIYGDAMIKFWDNGSAAWSFLRYPVFLALLIPACAGLLSRIKKPGPMEWFPVVYLPMVLLWPTPQGARFLIPVFPLFIFWAFHGLNRIRKPVIRNAFFGLLLMAVASTYAVKYGTLNFGPIPGGIGDEKQMACLSFIRDHTLKSDVFVCDEPRILALMAERKATSYFVPESDAAFWKYAAGINATHLILSPDEPQSIRNLIDRRRDGLTLVYDQGGFAVYKIL
jgi:4-amino-4-deoxy-L-arabinose transferase-like glycosyltransferase